MQIRTEHENQSFIETLESAIDKAEQAIGEISYSSYPEVNKDTIEQLKKAISIMEYGLVRNIYKP